MEELVVMADCDNASPGGLLRVLFITRKWPPAVGGMEVYSVELTKELATQVDLTTNILSGRKNGQPPTLLTLAWFFITQAIYLFRARNRFDVIHYGDLVQFPLAWFSHRLGRGCRQVISVHGTDIAYGIRKGWRSRFYQRFLSWMVANNSATDAVIANSQATARLCEKTGFKHVEVVNLGVRLSEKPLSNEHPENYVLFVGRLVARKGVGWFIREVLPNLPEGLTLKVAGTVWDADEGAALQSPRVDFLGPVFGHDLLQQRRKALAVIMPNKPLWDGDFVEGFGLTALEAGADGAVLLASALDGIVDAVEDGVTGVLVEAGNKAAWVEAIENVSNWSPDYRASFLQNARQRIRERYNWHRVADQTISIYKASMFES